MKFFQFLKRKNRNRDIEKMQDQVKSAEMDILKSKARHRASQSMKKNILDKLKETNERLENFEAA